MVNLPDLRDWYWRRDDGQVWYSGLGRLLSASDSSPKNWTRWPEDDSGKQTDAALDAVLNGIGLAGPGGALVPESVSSAQAKIQLARTPGSVAGKTLFDDAKDAANGAGAEVAIWFSDARTWQRKNAYVVQIGKAMKLEDTVLDTLFIAAEKIEA